MYESNHDKSFLCTCQEHGSDDQKISFTFDEYLKCFHVYGFSPQYLVDFKLDYKILKKIFELSLRYVPLIDDE